MMWSSRSLRRMATAAAVVSALLLVAGCSSMGPDDASELGAGGVSGTVTTQRGAGIPSIAVTMCSDFESTEQTTQTGETGDFSVADLEMSAKHAFSETYDVYVNRTSSSSTPLDDSYGTYCGTVVVAKDQTATLSIVLERVDDGPSDPEQIVDGS